LQTASSVNEPGRLPGASVALTSRSGSNDFHGSAVYRVRHELLAANDWFANSAGVDRGPLRLNDVAPSLGGPIRHDKDFFFGSFAGYRFIQYGNYSGSLPTPAQIAGNFSENTPTAAEQANCTTAPSTAANTAVHYLVCNPVTRKPYADSRVTSATYLRFIPSDVSNFAA